MTIFALSLHFTELEILLSNISEVEAENLFLFFSPHLVSILTTFVFTNYLSFFAMIS